MNTRKKFMKAPARKDGRINLRGLTESQLSGLAMLQSQWHTKSLNQTVLKLIDKTLANDSKRKTDFYFQAYLESEIEANRALLEEINTQKKFRKELAYDRDKIAEKLSHYFEDTGRIDPEEDEDHDRI